MKVLLGIIFLIGSAQAGTRFISESTLENINYDGIIAIGSPMQGGCSASLVRFEGSKDGEPAMILTNGHCVETGMPKPGTFILNQASSRSFNVLDPVTGKTIGKLKAAKLMYATMTHTDFALYQLTDSFSGVIGKFNVHPLMLSKARATVRDPIEIISGFWRRGYACRLEAVVPTLKEAGWTMRDSLRYSRPGCETIGGTSGSPILLAGTRIVIGINNTGNEDGEMCTMNNPCEVSSTGVTSSTKGVSYGQQINDLYGCLTQDHQIALSLPTCKLFGSAR